MSFLINPYSFGTPGGSGALDAYTAPTGAFSASRKLLTAYGGSFYGLTSGAVSTWYDQTGGGGDVTDQGNSSWRPAVSTAGPNSIACLDFNGSAHQLHSSPISMAQFITKPLAYIVVSGIWDTITADISVNAYAAHVFMSADAYIDLGAGDNAGAKKALVNHYDGSHDRTPEVTVAAGTAYVLAWRHESGNSYLSVNGAAEVSVASGDTDAITPALWFGGGANTTRLDGKLFEAALWGAGSVIPNGTERTAIVANFMTQCGAV